MLIISVSLVISQIIGLLQQEPANHVIYQTSGMLIQMLVNHAQQLIFMILAKDDVSALLQHNMSITTINAFLAFPLVFGTLIHSNVLLVLLVSLIPTVIVFAHLQHHM